MIAPPTPRPVCLKCAKRESVPRNASTPDVAPAPCSYCGVETRGREARARPSGISPPALETIVRDIGRTIAGAVAEASPIDGPALGFAFFLFDFGDRGSLAYTATADRADVVKLLEELIVTLRGEVGN